jgi:Xaa-Pro dipeptidase
LADALERAGRKGLKLNGVLFHAGRTQTYHADDEEVVFWSTPHFRRWAPLAGPEHLVVARPGRKPLVVRVQPRDYWFDTTPPPPSYWEQVVELREVESFAAARAAAGALDAVAYVGNSPAAAAELGIGADRIEPAALMAPLDWHRAAKTDHELALIEAAARRTARGHRRGREAFFSGASEREIHYAYLQGSEQLERQLPFGTIGAHDHTAATHHYQQTRGAQSTPARVLLLDAGASCDGYAADLTRTWARTETDPVFQTLLRRMDEIEQKLVGMVRPGRPYLEIHLEAHRLVAELLAETEILKTSAAEGLERGLTRVFLPHGVGHQLGIQVHDVGGRQAGPDGGTVPPPPEHPYLRNTRTLEPGHVVTIEPGIYFIGLLLEPLRAGAGGALIDWKLVDRLAGCGGVRIEDNVVCTAGGSRDLTRPLIEGPRGV